MEGRTPLWDIIPDVVRGRKTRYTLLSSARLYTIKPRLTVGVPMCGRFTMATNPAALEERFHARLSTEIAEPTYNAAPSQAQLTILNNHPDAIVRAAWGFVPEWADGRPDVKPLINTRAETVGTKPVFRYA